MVRNPIEIEVQIKCPSILVEIDVICRHPVSALYFETGLESYLRLQLLLISLRYNRLILEILPHRLSITTINVRTQAVNVSLQINTLPLLLLIGMLLGID